MLDWWIGGMEGNRPNPPCPNIDDSSSMEYEDGGNRKDMLKKVLEAIADVYELAREEGIVSVRFLNNPTGRKDIKKADVAGLHAEIQYDGVTMTGTELQNKILKPFVLEPQTPMRKPLLTMIITDGDVSLTTTVLYYRAACGHHADSVSRLRARSRGC